MSAPERIEPYDKRYTVRGFDSGQPALDRWLIQYAGQNERRDTARTYLAVDDRDVVVGYYSLVASEIRQAEATAALRSGTSPHFPIPACLLTRLAVDRQHQGRKIGAKLLAHALERVLRANQHIGIRGLAVSAIDANAADFYSHFGFDALDVDRRKLMVPMLTIERLVDPAR
ncbi:MAG TPA: GNAT family N-acetyltransferase [Thermoleophilaceae bacterium]|nr:GNAT family N-acetyltransferase [Thermoleophilaceae bacterium]